MKHIATLGPPGTFSEKATKAFISNISDECHIDYFSSIKQVLNSIGERCQYAVLPIENLSEGFISLVLDHLVICDITIVSEIQLPIEFSFVSNKSSLSETDKIFVQFVSKGQCSDFIDSLENIDVIMTESNIESLEMVLKKNNAFGAIVPSGSFKHSDFMLAQDHVNDFKNNQTRFIVLSNKQFPINTQINKYRTSIIVLDDNDHPGLLQDVLSPFSKRGINLTSIVSRPSRQIFGRYHFFIDFDGHINDSEVAEALEEIGAINKIKILGSYPKAEFV